VIPDNLYFNFADFEVLVKTFIKIDGNPLKTSAISLDQLLNGHLIYYGSKRAHLRSG